MARIILGLAASHSPLLALEGGRWAERAADDRRNQRLNLSDGRYLSYDQLAAETGEPHAAVATEAQFLRHEAAAQAALDRLAALLAETAPDAVLIVGDDQAELYAPTSMPAIALLTSAELVMKKRAITAATPSWVPTVARGYAMDQAHRFPAHPALARALVEGLVAREFDIATVGEVPDPEQAGFGHAYGFIIRRLFGGRAIPVVPLLLNTYFPPNVPTPRRCLALGQALRETIVALPEDWRIAVVASGGLSHFVVDEALDRRILAALEA